MNKFKRMFAFLLLAMGLVVANVAEAVKIGDIYEGGIVFFVDNGGQHGLIAARADQNGGAGIPWYNGTYFVTNATADGLYAGVSNTNLIISTQTTVALLCSDKYWSSFCSQYNSTTPAITGNYAALVAQEYSVQEDGQTACTASSSSKKCYGDWYLPSKYELNLMYSNIGPNVKTLKNKWGFAYDFYWSSTEDCEDCYTESNPYNAWSQDFFNGYPSPTTKNLSLQIRVIRSFSI